MPRTTLTSQRAAEFARDHAQRRLNTELLYGHVGDRFVERLKHQITHGYKPAVNMTCHLWDIDFLDDMLDACDRGLFAWRAAVAFDRIEHGGRYLSAFCDSLVRVPPTYDVTCIPYPNEAPHVHEAFKRAQTQIERNRALTQVAAFSHAVMDGDGAIRARVAGFLV